MEQREHDAAGGDAFDEGKRRQGQEQRLPERSGSDLAASRYVEECAEECARFASMVSHELRGPLATLTGYAQLLARGSPSQTIADKATKAILDQAKRINQIVENLLQAGRLAKGGFRFSPNPTDLTALLRRIIADSQATSKTHQLALEVPDMPIVGQWDASLLGLAIQNLVANAIKFSPEGGQVRVSLRQDDGTAVVTIADQGMGIAPEDRQLIFHPYQRPARTLNAPGVGVGLFVAKGVVSAHHGQIAFDSELGKGSTFYVHLPLMLEDRKDAEVETHGANAKSSRGEPAEADPRQPPV